MVLADRGLLHVDDPVYKYLSGFDTGAKKQITLRHLLTHTAGLYEWYPLFYRSAHRDSTIQLIESLPLRFPVGKQRRYSDLGFMLLGAIVEKVSGMPLDRFEEENVFGPLGMIHTTYNPLKHPYRLVKQKKVISPLAIEEGSVNLIRYIRRGYPIVKNQPKTIG